MNKLMIVVGSVRPGRIGLPIAEWVRSRVEETDFELDFADLAEIDLPFMDEPNHPMRQQYTKPHTLAWSERVAAADAFIFVTPEYNYGFSPALKNAIDYLHREWWRKPFAVVSYGGASAGTRAAVALAPTLAAFGMIRSSSNIELPFAMAQVAEGAFTPNEKESAIMTNLLADLSKLAEGTKALRAE